jgi:integrase
MSRPYLRGSIYWISFTDASGKHVRETTGTSEKRKAQEYLDRRRAEAWRHSRLGEKPDRLWEEAAVRWLQENTAKKTIDEDADKIEWFNQYFAGKRLSELTDDFIQYTVEKNLQTAKSGKPISGSTKNKYYGLITSILRRANKRWKWTDHLPSIDKHREPKGVVRYLTPDEAKTFLNELPEHLQSVVTFALATGLRMRNVTHLRWDQVNTSDGMLFIDGDEMKSGRPTGKPLNKLALSVLLSQVGKHTERVFTYQGKPIDNAHTAAFQKALKRAGIKKFRFHDLRHTWASWLLQNGADIAMVQELGDWRSAHMVKRYAHLSPQHLAPTSSIIDGVLK